MNALVPGDQGSSWPRAGVRVALEWRHEQVQLSPDLPGLGFLDPASSQLPEYASMET